MYLKFGIVGKYHAEEGSRIKRYVTVEIKILYKYLCSATTIFIQIHNKKCLKNCQ